MFLFSKSQKEDEQVTFEELSTVHSPEDPGEAERILSSGGTIRKAVNKFGEMSGPLRVFQGASKVPGLMMTRSFGDKIGHLVGLSCCPSTLK